MRIVSGAWRGRALAAPAGDATRPTSDRVRQALFDRLAHAPWAAGRLQGARVLDGFAGTGALGLEALSRGAAHAVFVEGARPALVALRGNVAACGAEERSRVLPLDMRRLPACAPGAACGLVFLDPPYRKALLAPALAALQGGAWLAPGALVVMEMARDEALPEWGEELAGFQAGAARVVVVRAP